MRRLLLLVALVLPTSLLADETFDYKLTFDDGVPGVMHARVEKTGEKKHTVSCDYAVSQAEEMGTDDMPLGSWRVTGVEKADRAAVRELCLRHYRDAVPHR